MADNVPRLGNLITEPQARDAIHIAVAPVTAGEFLRPGTPIGFVGDAFTVGTNAEHIGIVDPFLTKDVKKGDMFYMFLYPNTITGLRHEWTHPAFEKEDMVAEMEPTFNRLKGFPLEEKWIADYAAEIGTTYSELMAAADAYLKTGDYFCRGGDFEGMSVPAEFWDKYETITRQTVRDRGSFFSCSC